EDAQINILPHLKDNSSYPFWDVKPWLSRKPAISRGSVFPIWNSRGDQAEAESSRAVATLCFIIGPGYNKSIVKCSSLHSTQGVYLFWEMSKFLSATAPLSHLC